MKKWLLVLLLPAYMSVTAQTTTTKVRNTTKVQNTLTPTEKKLGWKFLFDGKTTKGWHTYNKKTIGTAWKVEDGTLYLDTTQKQDWQIKNGGDIVTNQEYKNFHLKLEWKIAPGGNSGVIFLIKEDPKYQYVWLTGPEMQILDNTAHSDAQINKHRAGDLYDLIACSKETVKAVGEWNQAEIICNNGKLNFFLNGVNVVSTTLWTEEWKKLVASSKFNRMSDFGTYTSGKIALQDHGNKVSFRNIKIKKL
jgi:hypothetical protein